MPVFFDPSEAPGPGEFDNADVIQSMIFAAKAPPMQRPPFLSTVAVPGTSTVGDGKPTAFSDAFVLFGLPEVLHAPFLTMVEANPEDDPSVQHLVTKARPGNGSTEWSWASRRFCAASQPCLAGVLRETKLNVYDTVAYMAIPATVFLLPIAIFVQKPVPGLWRVVFEKEPMSDWAILVGVWSLSQSTMAWLFLSGVFSVIYNIIQFSIVHTLSPSATAFGGNFNKAALIF